MTPVFNRSLAPLLLAACLSPAATISSARAEQMPQPAVTDWTAVQESKLESGLGVVLQPTTDAPLVSVCTAFGAGVSGEAADKGGVTRLLAELMKEGGYRSTSQDYEKLVRERGGVNEVEVDYDSTVFCTTVPRSELPLALWVAQGRFTTGALTESELESARERLALASEVELDAVRGVQAPQRLRRMAFLGAAAYARPTLPAASELERVTLADVKALHNRTYGAKQGFLAVSGGFDLEQLRPLLESHLGHVRAGQDATPSAVALVRQNTPRFSMAEDPNAKQPAAWYGWVMPETAEREALHAGLLILTGPSRLGKITDGVQAASELDLSIEDASGPALARIEVAGRGSQSLGTIEKELDGQIDQLAKVAPAADEVLAAQKALHEQRARELVSSRDRALRLSRGRLLGLPAAQILAPLAHETAPNELSGEAIRQAVARYLGASQRSVVEIYPKGWQDPWQAPMPLFHIVNPGESLGAIARQYRTTVPGLVKMNKGLNPKTAIYPGDKLRVPRGHAGAEPQPLLHKVKRADTLGGLALHYGVGVREIAEANGMSPKQSIRLGEELRIPRPKKGEPSSSKEGPAKEAASNEATLAVVPAFKLHEVKAGETLSGIAAKRGISAVRLAQANGLSQKAMVRVGQMLKLPEPETRPTPAPVVEDSRVTHKVKTGETLSAIAKKYGLTVAQLTAANGLARKATLQPGQTLNIPKK